VLILESKLGLSPWDVLNQGIAKHTPLSFGMANVAVAIVVLGIGWSLGGRPSIGTVANAVLVGSFIQVLTSIGAITDLAQAAPPLPATRAEIEARLQKAAHGLSATEVADLGASAGVLLAQIADDRAVATTMRARAMEALTYVRTPVTRDFLENFLIRKRPSSDAEKRSFRF